MISNRALFFPMMIMALVVASGCLKTRTSAKDSEQRQVLQQQVSNLQKDHSDSSSRFSDVNEQIRDLRGRVEVVENQLSIRGNEMDKTRQAIDGQTQGLDRKVSLLQESLVKLEAQNQTLTAEVLALKAELAGIRAEGSAASHNPSMVAPSAAKDSFMIAKDLFEEKEWKRAILAFQKYRDGNPKGKNVAEATYLMGVCFQELKMKDESQSFYDEVIANFPKSNEARKARARLKSLK